MVTDRLGVARGIAAVVALFLAGQQAVAADFEPVDVAAPKSPWQIRLRALGVFSIKPTAQRGPARAPPAGR